MSFSLLSEQIYDTLTFHVSCMTTDNDSLVVRLHLLYDIHEYINSIKIRSFGYHLIHSIFGVFFHKFTAILCVFPHDMTRRPSPLDNEQCRQCSSFSDYMKSTKKKINKGDPQGNSTVSSRRS